MNKANPKIIRLSPDISISGNYKKIKKAEQKLKPIVGMIQKLNQHQARLALQKAIDEFQLSASIMYQGHLVWSEKKILRNLDKIIEKGMLYHNGDNKVTWMRVKKGLYLPSTPKNFKPILSEYFYQFLTIVCGSKPHYSKAGWIGLYPTLNDLKRFFQKNEYGKPVSEYVPAWKADAKKIVTEIELKLYPFKSYVKANKNQHNS
jgi:hypothetical protein